MNKNIFKILSILLFITALASTACVKQDRVSKLDYDTITNLNRSCSYEKIVTAFSAYPWSQEKDPGMLMIYCEALVETNRSFPSYLQHPPLPAYQSEFAQGYYAFLRGEYRKALTSFSNLSGDHSGAAWGYIGALEFAVDTESITIMEGLLKQLQTLADQDASSVPDWAIPYYKASYYFYSGKFSQVNEVIRKYNKLLDPVAVVMLRVPLLIRENRLEEARKTITDMPAEFLNDQRMIAIESDLIKVESGPEQCLKYLQEKNERFSYMRLITERYADVLIETGQIQQGVDMLKKLARKRPYDIMLQLNLAEKLIYYEKGKGAEDILLSVIKDNIGIPYYELLVAKIYLTRGDEDKSQQALAIAKKLYPDNPGLLWFAYTLAMRKHDYAHAFQTIKKMIEIYPNDVPALVSLMEVSYLSGKWNELSAAEKTINRSNRYISVETWDKVKSYKAQALAAQGKFDKAHDVLEQIKEASVRDKTTAEIDSLKKGNKKQ